MAKKKAHHPFLLTTSPRTYDGRTAEIGVNNGSGAVGLWMRYTQELSGPAASLTPAQARALGQDLIERADELDGKA